MKRAKQLTALALCLCMLIGLPISVQAVGTETPSEFQLLSVMELTTQNAMSSTDSLIDKAIVLYFNQRQAAGTSPAVNFYLDPVKADGSTGTRQNLSVKNVNYYHHSSNPDGSQRAMVLGLPDGTTFTSLRAAGYVSFRLYMREQGGAALTGYIEALKDWKNRPLKATTVHGGNLDAISMSIVTEDNYLRIKDVIRTGENKISVKFSQPVDMAPLANDGGPVDVWVRVVDRANNNYVNGTTQVKATAVTNHGNGWVEFTINDIAKVEQALKDADNADYAIKLLIADKAANLSVDRGETIYNKLVDGIWSTATNMPLLVANRGSSDNEICDFDTTLPLTLTDAKVYSNNRVALRFSAPVKKLSDNVDIRLGFYKNGVLDDTHGTWAFDASTAAYYGVTGDTLILDAFSVSTSIQSVAASLGSEYTMGLTVTSSVKDDDGMVNEFGKNDGDGLLLATTIAEQDNAFVEASMVDESLPELVKVEMYKEDSLLLFFNREVEAKAENQYVGLTLLDQNDKHYYYAYDEATGTFRVSATHVKTDEYPYMCQWNLEWRGTYRENAILVKVQGAQGDYNSPAALKNSWTLSRILEVCEGSGGKLYLRVQENANNNPNSGTVDTVYAKDDPSNALLATLRGKQDQVRYEVLDCRNEIVVESAQLITEDTVKITFNKEMTNTWYDAVNQGSVILRLAEKNDAGQWVWKNFYNGQPPHVQWGAGLSYFYNYDPNNTPTEDIPDKTQASKVWYYKWSGDNTDILELLSMTQDPESVYYGLTLTLALERNGTITVPNSVQNFTTADGKYVLIQNNSGNAGHYAPIQTSLPLLDLVKISDVAVKDENRMTVTFSQAVVAMNNISASIRLVKADGTVEQSSNVTLVSVDGQTYEIVLPIGGTYRSFSALWQRAQAIGGRLELAIAQTTGNKRDGMVDGVVGASGASLISSINSPDTLDTYYKEIIRSDFAFNPDSFEVSKVKQTGAHTLLVEFSEDIRLVDMDKKPYFALRMVDPATGSVVRVIDGVPTTSNGSNTYIQQWGSQSVDLVDGRTDALMITFPDTIDISVLASKVNMDPMFLPYEVRLVMEESASASTDLVTRANGLMHHIRRADDEKQLESTYKPANTRVADAVVLPIEWIDPTADLQIEKVEVVDQTRIVVTFSEAVELKGPDVYIRLIESHYFTKTDANGNRMMWGVKAGYYDDAHTQVVFTLKDVEQNHAKIPVDGLHDLFAKGYEDDTWRLVLAIGDGGSARARNGIVDSIVSTTGKALLADPMTGMEDYVFLDLDLNEVPTDNLYLMEATLVSEMEAVLTFSAPVNIVNNPYLAVRLFDKDNKFLWRTAEGQYVTSSRNGEVSNKPMQWTCGEWEYYNDEHTQVKVKITSSMDNIGTFTDLLSMDWESIVPGSRLQIGYEENNQSIIENNGRVDNILLATDERVRLSGTYFDQSRDRAYVGIEGELDFKTLTASAKIINDMQIRITFSGPVKLTGDPYIALRYMNEKGALLYHKTEYSNKPMQWSGTWEWENEAHTSIIWTMNGNGAFGAHNLTDLVNYSNALEVAKGAPLCLCIEEKTNDDITVLGRNSRVDNITTSDGKSLMRATQPGGYDGAYMTLNTSALVNATPVTLLSVKAVDDQTIEMTFSEPVRIAEGDKAPTILLRYLSKEGGADVLANGKTANFKGTISYRESDPNVVFWTLDSPHAKSLTDIFNYEGTLKWNMGSRVVLIIENESEGIPSRTMRMWGITSADGMRTMSTIRSTNPSLQLDVEIAYDLPPRETDAPSDESPIEYYSDYTRYIVATVAIALLLTAVGVVVKLKRRVKK